MGFAYLSSLAGGLGCELFTGGFTTSRLASCLLGTSHFENSRGSVGRTAVEESVLGLQR